jgi:hypothetical protein
MLVHLTIYKTKCGPETGMIPVIYGVDVGFVWIKARNYIHVSKRNSNLYQQVNEKHRIQLERKSSGIPSKHLEDFL